MVVERRYVTSLLVPLAVEIVRHNCNPVQIFGEHRNVVAFVDHLFAWRDSRTEQQSSGSQFVAQLFQQICKTLFIRGGTFVAVNLGQVFIKCSLIFTGEEQEYLCYSCHTCT